MCSTLSGAQDHEGGERYSMTDESANEDILLGRQAMVTDALTHFMHSRGELAEFVSYYHNLAGTAFRWGEPDFDEALHKQYLGQSIFFLENYMIRLSGMVDIYIEDLVIDLASNLPGFLEANELENARSRLRKRGYSNVEEIEAKYEAGRYISKLSKPEIAATVQQRCGIDFSRCGENWREILILTQIRNIIVHNNSYVDEKFDKVCVDLHYKFRSPVGQLFLLPEKEVMRIAAGVDDSVWMIDAEASALEPIFKRDRFGHIWLSRSVWAREELGKRLNDWNALEP